MTHCLEALETLHDYADAWFTTWLLSCYKKDDYVCGMAVIKIFAISVYLVYTSSNELVKRAVFLSGLFEIADKLLPLLRC